MRTPQQHIPTGILVRRIPMLSVLFLAAFVAPTAWSDDGVARGDIAPDFTLPVLANAPTKANTTASSEAAFSLLRLSDFHGTVIYLDFWQVACAPCREAMPKLNALREEFSRKDVEFLAVNTDISPRDAVEFVAANAVAYPIVADPSGQVADRYGAHTLPTAFLISREGKVERVHRGFNDKDVEKIRDQLRALSGVRSDGKLDGESDGVLDGQQSGEDSFAQARPTFAIVAK